MDLSPFYENKNNMELTLEIAKKLYKQGGYAKELAIQVFPEEDLQNETYANRFEDLINLAKPLL